MLTRCAHRASGQNAGPDLARQPLPHAGVQLHAAGLVAARPIRALRDAGAPSRSQPRACYGVRLCIKVIHGVCRLRGAQGVLLTAGFGADAMFFGRVDYQVAIAWREPIISLPAALR